MAPRWLCHGAGQNTSQRSVGSRVSAPHAIEVPITVYGGWCWGWGLNPQPDVYKSPALSY